MSDYQQPPRPPESPFDRRVNKLTLGCIGAFILLLIACAYAVFTAAHPPTREEHAKDWVGPPRPTESRRPRTPRYETRSRPTAPVPAKPPGPQVPPPVEHAPAEGPMTAQGETAREFKPPRALIVEQAGYAVGDDFHEPPMEILRQWKGQGTVTLHHLLETTPLEFRDGEEVRPPITVPVEVLRLVNPKARQTILGVRVGNTAYKTAMRRPRNSRYYRPNPRIACAAFVSAMFKANGVRGLSFAVNMMYPQLRKRGGKIVVSRMPTRYTPHLAYLKAGDIVFFHHRRGSRLAHVEVYCGRGLCAGTSSSVGYVAVRKIGNRGYTQATVIRV